MKQYRVIKARDIDVFYFQAFSKVFSGLIIAGYLARHVSMLIGVMWLAALTQSISLWVNYIIKSIDA